jgi:hypothetical protein
MMVSRQSDTSRRTRPAQPRHALLLSLAASGPDCLDTSPAARRRFLMSGACSVDGCLSAIVARGYCNKHYIRWRNHGDPMVNQGAATDPVTRAWKKVQKTETCWIWTGAKTPTGYGHFMVGSKSDQSRRWVAAHRFFFERLIGPIPEGLTLDHLCSVPSCVNPAHLEPVTMAENVRRGSSPAAVAARASQCSAGHPYDQQNTHYTANGSRRCRTCNAERARAYRSKARQP